ncbi:MAG: carbohydrate binding domain-containing protein [archaeon]
MRNDEVKGRGKRTETPGILLVAAFCIVIVVVFCLQSGAPVKQPTNLFDNVVHLAYLDDDFRYWSVPGSPEIIAGPAQLGNATLVDGFEGSVSDYRIEKYGPGSQTDDPSIDLDVGLSDDAHSGNRSMRLSFNFGEPTRDYTDKHVKVYRSLAGTGLQDWTGFRYVSFAIKSDAIDELLYFWVVDGDGDWWHYNINLGLFPTDEWLMIRIPLDTMKLPDERFPFHGNGERDFGSVMEYRFRIDQLNLRAKGNNTNVNIDSIMLWR